MELNGLTMLSDAAADSLSRHQGDLSLNGLLTLSDTAAESLRQHSGSLELNGLVSLSDEAQQSLRMHKAEKPPPRQSFGMQLGDATPMAWTQVSWELDIIPREDLGFSQETEDGGGHDTALSDYINLDPPHTASSEPLNQEEPPDASGLMDPFKSLDLTQELLTKVCESKTQISTSETQAGAPVNGVHLDLEHLLDPPGTEINSIGMKLVPIQPGEFMMGGREGEEGYNPVEERLHRVRITRPFLMGMYQVTQGEYAAIVGQNPSTFHGKTRPVEHVSWKDAADFCRRLSEQPAEKSAGRVYRLPTEAEWEYACRAGSESAFSCGDELTPVQANFCEGWTTQRQPTCPVGMYPPNGWGLFDMHGNVWEWCQDWYGLDYYANSPVDDPRGPSEGDHHVCRGGSASVCAHECRAAIRGESAADGPDPEGEQRYAVIGDFGLRVVCELSAIRAKPDRAQKTGPRS